MNEPGRRLPVVQPQEVGSPPIFQKIGIVGLGLVGGSIGLAARRLWPAGLVIAVDQKDVLEKAMVLHAIDIAADDPIVLAEADLIILAAPVRQNIARLADLVGQVEGRAIVTDTGSTKRAIVQVARRLPPRLTFIGGHPLGGAARAGIDHARPDLFEGRPWVFTPERPERDESKDSRDSKDSQGSQDTQDREDAHEPLERLFAFARALGARPLQMGAADHDRLMAFLSHLPQLTASALMQVVGDAVGADGLALSGRGLVDTTRLASSPSSNWRDICATNADEIRRSLDALISLLQEVRSSLDSGDVIDRLFEAANAWRDSLLAGK